VLLLSISSFVAVVRQATAFLWRVVIELVQADLDLSPVIGLAYRTNHKEMTIAASNAGWGRVDCQVSVHNEILERLFRRDSLRFQRSFESGEIVDVIHLNLRLADSAQLDVINRTGRERTRRQHDSPQLRSSDGQIKIQSVSPEDLGFAEGVPVGHITAQSTCSNAAGIQLTVNQEIRPDLLSFANAVSISDGEFKRIPPPIMIYTIAMSEPTFVAVLDPASVPSEKAYSISRKIPPGDMERFSITVGALKSSKVRLRFKFFVDASIVLTTNSFTLTRCAPETVRSLSQMARNLTTRAAYGLFLRRVTYGCRVRETRCGR
jgi:hypothetical protein